MRILIVGAGLEGVVSAWYLARDGHQVTLIERREAVGLETSHANGGQISVSHPEPWANPRAPGQILRWVGREDAPLLFRMPAEWARWRWGLSFLRNCTPGRTHRNTRAIAALAAYSLRCLHELQEATQLDFHQEQRGVLHLFFDKGELRRAPMRAAQLAACGLRAEVLDRNGCLAIEPALAHCADHLLGGLHGIDDESGDAFLFTQGLADALTALGVTVHLCTTVDKLELADGRLVGVRIHDGNGRQGQIQSDICVLCAGPWSPVLARAVGENLPIYPVKGYSVTLPVIDPTRAPQVSLTDETRRIVCSRFDDRLRIAGTAELNGFDQSPNPARTNALLRWADEHLPGATDLAHAETWNGLRPTTPTNLPIIGPSRRPGLWLNTGHGTLGWTLACGSAKALSDLIAGRAPEVQDFPFRRA